MSHFSKYINIGILAACVLLTLFAVFPISGMAEEGESLSLRNGVSTRSGISMKTAESPFRSNKDSHPSRTNRKGSPFSMFVNSFFIIMREGFEAILIISALVAYLIRSGNEDKVKVVYKGGIMALAASVVTAYLLHKVVATGGEEREAIEGVTMILASGILFYVSYWLISKREVAKWQGYIKSKVDSSIGRGNVFALGFASFIAVYREGAETALFYIALYSTSTGRSDLLFAGIVAGALALAVIFFLFRYFGTRIPLGPFFAVTSTLLYYLAFVFAGKGVHALQEASWISETAVTFFPKISAIGLYPTVEGILLQLLLIVAMIIAVIYGFIVKPYTEKMAIGRDLSHIEGDIDMIHSLLEDIGAHAAEIRSWARDENIPELQRHVNEVDVKIHEIMGHLGTLKKYESNNVDSGLED